VWPGNCATKSLSYRDAIPATGKSVVTHWAPLASAIPTRLVSFALMVDKGSSDRVRIR
jgi:hypothetical protein